MTAASAYPPGSDQGATESRGSEQPSMEDILASIRRIIADDQQSTGARPGSSRNPPTTADAAPAPADRDDILDLARYTSAADRDHPADAPAEPGRHHEGAFIDHAEADTGALAHQPQAASAEQFGSPEAYETDDEPRDVSLMGAPMSESVMSAFEALAATVVLENKPMLERILRDLLRPMLKTWLDDNLPGLVERLVRVEIERVARGGRG